MMEWIELSKERPSSDIIAYVTNVHAGFSCYIAIYDEKLEFFRSHSPYEKISYPLEVTHWIELPTAHVLHQK